MLDLTQRQYLVKRLEQEHKKKEDELFKAFFQRVKIIENEVPVGERYCKACTLSHNYTCALQMLENKVQHYKDIAMLEERFLPNALIGEIILASYTEYLDMEEEL